MDSEVYEDTYTDLTFLQDILPDGFETVIRDFELLGGPTEFSCLLRLPIFKKEDAIQWLKEFEKKSKTGWRVDRTYKELTSKIVFKKEYHCDHNSRPKNGSKPRDKHTSCNSKLTITINQSMKRSKDLYNTSHPCQVRIRFIHNHDFSVSTASKKRKTAESTDEWFEDNFSEIGVDDQEEQNNVARCQEGLQLVFVDMVRKLSENPSLYAEPLNEFITLYNNCETDSAHVSALCNFGKHNEKLCSEKKRKLEVQQKIKVESEKIKLRRNMNKKLSKTNEQSIQKSKLDAVMKRFRPIQKKLVTTQPFLILLKSSSCEK